MSPLSELTFAFRKCDAKQDGYIKEQELLALMRKIMPSFPLADFQKAICRETFYNNGNVKYEEFIYWLALPEDILAEYAERLCFADGHDLKAMIDCLPPPASSNLARALNCLQSETPLDKFRAKLCDAPIGEISRVISKLSPDLRIRLTSAIEKQTQSRNPLYGFRAKLSVASNAEVSEVVSKLPPHLCTKLSSAFEKQTRSVALAGYAAKLPATSASNLREVARSLSQDSFAKLLRATESQLSAKNVAEQAARISALSQNELKAMVGSLSQDDRAKLMSAVNGLTSA